MTQRTLRGMLFLARSIRDILEEGGEPRVNVLEERVDELDEQERVDSCVDDLFAVGGSIRRVVRAVTVRAAGRQLYHIQHNLGARD